VPNLAWILAYFTPLLLFSAFLTRIWSTGQFGSFGGQILVGIILFLVGGDRWNGLGQGILHLGSGESRLGHVLLTDSIGK
jgi:hypothetical protein